MKLAANLSSLWAELPYLDRFDAAASAGFQGVAVPFPYELAAKDTTRACLRAGLQVVQITAPPPNYTGGARGFAAMPGLEDRFKYDLRRALRYCDALNVPVLHIMAGAAQGDAARATLVENLRHAVSVVPKGISLTLQPQAQDGAFLSSYALAADVINEVGAGQLGLQLHSQHARQLHGDVGKVFETYAPMIRHIQIDHELASGASMAGAIELSNLQDLLNRYGYDGWVVADYSVTGATEDTLNWVPQLAS
ncbi:MAG: TIM barrel protein [Roseobacter sp.]